MKNGVNCSLSFWAGRDEFGDQDSPGHRLSRLVRSRAQRVSMLSPSNLVDGVGMGTISEVFQESGFPMTTLGRGLPEHFEWGMLKGKAPHSGYSQT